jgi:CDP-diacylglycerol---serine O-phosphatidyltransferase
MNPALEEVTVTKKKSKRKATIAVLPSLLTGIGLFCGFYSIILSFQEMMGEGAGYAAAGISIILASFLDGLDGRLARLMKAESKFGFQFDSIADMVSFGVAPAVLVYISQLHSLGRLGLMAAFLYVACAAFRLARFNVLSEESPASRKYFKGMSSPVAAGGIALTAMLDHPFGADAYRTIVLVCTIILSLLMVSNIRFRSFKQIEVLRGRPMLTMMIVILLVVLVFSFHELALFGCFIAYFSWGIAEEVVLWRRRRKSDPSVPFVPFGERARYDPHQNSKD